MIADVRDMKALTRELVSTTSRLAEAAEENQRRLMGHWDDTAGKWRPGLLQTQEMLGQRLEELVDTIKETAQETAEAAKKSAAESRKAITSAIGWMGTVVSGIIVAAAAAWITITIQNHAATLSTLQGHIK